MVMMWSLWQSTMCALERKLPSAILTAAGTPDVCLQTLQGMTLLGPSGTGLQCRTTNMLMMQQYGFVPEGGNPSDRIPFDLR